MNIKDFFVSYNKADKDWAKWIAGTLEENGFSVYVQAWDIVPGDDFIERMSVFLECSKNYIAVLSNAFCSSEYCKKEFQTAFNAHINKKIDKFIPMRIENVLISALYTTTVYIDLFDVDESKAREKLLNGVGYTENRRKKGKFPGGASSSADALAACKPTFPGMSDGRPSCDGFVTLRNILILETEKRRKKELFRRLIYDVFHTLGFGEPRTDTPRSSRDIDVVFQHRTENRFALVKSKVAKDQADSAEVNKFVGVLDIEKGKYQDGNGVVGYFLAQSGFKPSALEQENERITSRKIRNENNNLVLLGPKEIARELVQGNIICSLEMATKAVKRSSIDTLSLCKEADLIASAQGWIWVLYYAKFPEQSAAHYAFVHADGNRLHDSIAEVIQKKIGYKSAPFEGLSYLAEVQDSKLNTQAAKSAYFKYLETELGEIQFEGMPTDKEAGAIKVNLESIFVPMRFDFMTNGNGKELHAAQTSIEGVLVRTSKAAILAKPGGGKSTLIRRIALAYAFPERKQRVDDELPDRNWFPVYIRCRDLGDDATKSVLEIISTIIRRAEITEYKCSFEALVADNLQEGQVLLLIDGLDEISNEKYRICFVNQLRTFVATYPNIHMIITSREAGFRAVAGTIACYCEKYSIASFQESEIRLLSLKWHQAILGESAQAEIESNKVCDIILNDRRIIALAENPLLLTTLLFVKRWVGYLPTKKCRLYEEMIKLLLVTWNAAAHDRLDMDETEPQLAYVAYCMTLLGQQKVTRDKLNKFIIEARRALPELLSYTTISSSKLVDQVEERSSLLIQSGLEESDNGTWVPSYEFSHLSFQEYLTAKAISEGWIPNSGCDALEVLRSHINEDHWKEVVPLTAVLLGRNAKPLIEYLIKLGDVDDSRKNTDIDDQRPENVAPSHIANCIASEVPMSQDLLEKAIALVVRRKRSINYIGRRQGGNLLTSKQIFETILKSKYGASYREYVRRSLFYELPKEYVYQFADAWIEMYHMDYGPSVTTDCIIRLISSSNYEQQITGTLLMMGLAFQYKYPHGENKNRSEDGLDNLEILEQIFEFILKLLESSDALCVYSAAWCIAWSGYNEANIIPYNLIPSITRQLVELWVYGHYPYDVKRVISWGLCSVCMPNISKDYVDGIPELAQSIENYITKPENEFDEYAAIHLSVLTEHWTKDEIRRRLSTYSVKNSRRITRFLHENGY